MAKKRFRAQKDNLEFHVKYNSSQLVKYDAEYQRGPLLKCFDRYFERDFDVDRV